MKASWRIELKRGPQAKAVPALDDGRAVGSYVYQ
jgi:hypothetical protein